GILQEGLDPDDGNQRQARGPGVVEVRIKNVGGAFRVMYVDQFEQAADVLQCFKMKPDRTAKSKLDLAISRYKPLERKLQCANKVKVCGIRSKIRHSRP